MIRRTFFSAAVVCLVVTFSPAAYPFGVADIVDQVSQSNYQHYLDDILYTHTGNNRGWNKQHDAARSNIYTTFNSFGLATSYDPFQCMHDGTMYTCHNVVSVQPGTTRPDDIFIIGAHYDSVGNPGADDNASGVAAILEAARVMSQYSFEATILYIAFDREEDGLIGSQAYVSEHLNDNILGMVSLDMIAYNPAGSYYNTASIYGRSASNPIKQALQTSISQYGNGINAIINSGLDASDHAPFEWAGFNACLLIEAAAWSNPYYHQPQDSVDTPNYIDYAYATNMTRSAVGCFTTAAGLMSVPEPGSLIATGSGFAWMLLVIRRRVRRNSK